jgi:ABC-type dipeptide/oligopeptide/nickel transport system ATPase component
MKVTGLSGKSGTGKSYVATELSSKLGIDAIIDDGLLIAGGKIIAGESAKKQKTKIGAVKTAVFQSEKNAEEVAFAIAKLKPEHLLILGTSEDMVRLIAERLSLPEPSEIIHIEDVTTEKDRELAGKRRSQSGMHTIPAPTLQVKKQFSGYLIDPKRAFSKKENKTKTVIRPTYSYLGSYEISDKIIGQIVEHEVSITPGCGQLLFATSINGSDGMYIRAIINAEKGTKMMKAAEALQKRVYRAVEHMTSFNVLGVEVEIRGYIRS